MNNSGYCKIEADKKHLIQTKKTIIYTTMENKKNMYFAVAYKLYTNENGTETMVEIGRAHV